MSYSQVLAIGLTRKTWRARIKTIETLNNSWGFSPYIWDSLCQKYFSQESFFSLRDRIDELWALSERQDIQLHERSVLMMTYDNAYILKKTFIEHRETSKHFCNVFLLMAR